MEGIDRTKLPRADGRRWSITTLSAESARKIVVIWTLVAALLGVLAATATATPLRPIASNVTAFASDGARFVAWQASGGPVVVLDTRSGQRSEPAPGCELSDRLRASAGRFLITCGHTQDLLDADSGRVTALPSTEYGPEWQAVGSRYVEGPTGYETSCLNGRHREVCTSMYDIASGKTKAVAEADIPETDRKGAPPVCKALRPTLLKLMRDEIPSEYGYGRGLLVRWLKHGETSVTQLQLQRCGERRMIIGSPAIPVDIEVGGGLISWDSGHGTGGINPRGEYASSEEATYEHAAGRLITYDLATHRRTSWSLPRRPIAIPYEPTQVGIWGYSAHTDNDVFWAGGQTGACGKTGCSAQSYVLYVGRFDRY